MNHTTLIAYHGDPAIKAKYVERIQAHEAADEIIHGKYWENGRGCAVGCTVHSSSHAAFETELGISQMLARLEDTLFEGQRNGDAKIFPARFLAAITPGADLSRVPWKFLHWLLTEELTRRDDPRVSKEIKACADVLIPLMKGESIDPKAALAERDDARETAREVRYAATAAYAANAAATANAAAAAYAAYDDDAAYAAAYAAADTAPTPPPPPTPPPTPPTTTTPPMPPPLDPSAINEWRINSLNYWLQSNHDKTTVRLRCRLLATRERDSGLSGLRLGD